MWPDAHAFRFWRLRREVLKHSAASATRCWMFNVAKYSRKNGKAKVERVRSSITLLQQLWSKQFGEGNQQRGKGSSRSMH